jgi:hypothetical protein
MQNGYFDASSFSSLIFASSGGFDNGNLIISVLCPDGLKLWALRAGSPIREGKVMSELDFI